MRKPSQHQKKISCYFYIKEVGVSCSFFENYEGMTSLFNLNDKITFTKFINYQIAIYIYIYIYIYTHTHTHARARARAGGGGGGGGGGGF
jgi:hypothetical protein